MTIVRQLALVLLAIFSSQPLVAFGQVCAGSLDTTYVAPAFSPAPKAMAWDGDKLVIAGTNSLIRLLPNGNPDPSFQQTVISGSSVNPDIRAIARDEDGRFIVGGGLIAIGDISTRNFGRVLPDGAADATFRNRDDVLGAVNAIATQSGKVIVAGRFQIGTNLTYYGVLRLKGDGSIDKSYASRNTRGSIIGLHVLPDGKLLIADTSGSVARLDAEMEIDPTFTAVRSLLSSAGMLVQEDGKFLLYGGADPNPNSLSLPGQCLIRYMPDGSRDLNFPIVRGWRITTAVLQKDNAVIAGGTNLIRYLPNGELDPSFFTDMVVGSLVQYGYPSLDKYLTAVALDAQERIYVGGPIRSANGVTRIGMARLHNGEACGTFVSFETNRMTLVENFGDVAINLVRVGDLSSEVSVEIGYQSSFFGPLASMPIWHFANAVFQSGAARTSFKLQNIHNPEPGPNRFVYLALTNATSGAVFGQQRVCAITTLDAEATSAAGSIDPEFKPVMPTITDLKLWTSNRVAAATWEKVIAFDFEGNIDSNFNAPTVYPEVLSVWGEMIYATCLTNGVIRLDRFGVPDQSFTPDLRFDGYQPYQPARIIEATSDGKLYVAGPFNQVNGWKVAGLTRLNLDGSADTNFVVNPAFSEVNDRILDIKALADSSVLIAGSFSAFAGEYRRGLARLSTNGTLLQGFDPNLAGTNAAYVSSIAIQNDGKVLVGGGSDPLYSPYTGFVRRFNLDGSVDHSFSAPQLDRPLRQIMVDASGKIRLLFSDLSLTLLGLNPDGSREEGFGLFTSLYARKALLLPGGDILLGGAFSSVNTYSITNLAKARAHAVMPRFLSAERTNSAVELLFRTPIGKRWALEQSSDFVEWKTLAEDRLASENGRFQIQAQPGGTNFFYRLRND